MQTVAYKRLITLCLLENQFMFVANALNYILSQILLVNKLILPKDKNENHVLHILKQTYQILNSYHTNHHICDVIKV